MIEGRESILNISKMKLLIVDYKMGNLHSVVNKVRKNAIEPIVSSNPKDLIEADKIILPGVGHFSSAVSHLKDLQLYELLSEQVLVKRKPILGICLGMQLMAKYSEEGNSEGLGWFDAEIKRLKVSDSKLYKIPHIGWTSVQFNKNSALLKGVENGSDFYFVHSYFCKCNNGNDILSTSDYGGVFTSAIERDHIFGVQYHPEKSHDVGMQLFKNFMSL